MRESGLIVSIEESHAGVRVDHGGEGESCGKCGLCGGKKDLAPIDVKLPQDHSAKLGDRAEIEIHLPNAGLAAAIVFGIPLVGILLGAVLGLHIFPDKGEFFLIGGGLGGCVLGFILVAIIDRVCPSLHPRADFIRITKTNE